jgi:hypothetical protein
MINFSKIFDLSFGPVAFITGEKFRLQIGGGSKSKSSQTTDASTKVTTSNQQVGAAEGSTAFGASSRNEILGDEAVKITGSKDVTVERVDDAIINAAGTALNAASLTSVNAARDALSFGESALDRSLSSLDKATENAAFSQESSNTLVRQVNELFGSTVAKKSEDSQSQQSADFQKRIVLLFGIGTVAFVAYKLLK